MTPFRRILVPTDFEESAGRAVDFAIDLARAFDGTITLAHVYTIPTVYTEGFSWPIEGLEESAKKALDAEVARAREKLPRIDGVLAAGVPWEEILSIAKKTNAEAIVMGTHGRRGLPRLWLGSVAERVVRMSPLPVVIVPMPRG
jgi:nucleotide-binding universal stress UspA family protein